MKNTYLFLALAGFLLFSCAPASAQDHHSTARKLKRGVVNVVTAPLEIPKQTRIYWKAGAKKTDHILVWILSGFVKGSVNTVARIGSGLWDIASSPWETAKDDQPLFKPDYVFDGCKGLF
jgi:putative exosortase-associated protein (TIGR04073 family)